MDVPRDHIVFKKVSKFKDWKSKPLCGTHKSKGE